ncbi:hypothetical protein GCM10012280_23130 [Wenjunlia tyrosinilytica]|uniref:Uncharacterized protein n=1 Tax=Wenjunlia tyrosinilytica TaxID=1544741 RepID=A0A917ZP56_9ACTN|nr:hypothetical protein GCM10012280_23130 [Wenjunlia tyrosinilytica]
MAARGYGGPRLAAAHPPGEDDPDRGGAGEGQRDGADGSSRPSSASAHRLGKALLQGLPPGPAPGKGTTGPALGSFPPVPPRCPYPPGPDDRAFPRRPARRTLPPHLPELGKRRTLAGQLALAARTCGCGEDRGEGIHAGLTVEPCFTQQLLC